MLEEIRLKLIYEMPFYSALLNRCQIVYPSTRVPTASVRINPKGHIELDLNHDFLTSMSLKEATGILQHELLHLVMNHPKREKLLGVPKSQHMISNIAMDMAINQLIGKDNLPKECVYPDKFKLPDGKTYEYYYHELMKNAEQNKQQGNSIDEHDPMRGEGQEGQGEGTESGLAQEILDEIVEEAVKSAYKEAKVRGNVPHHVEALINESFNKAKLNWKSILKQFIGRSISSETESTRTRPNRRVGFRAQGAKKIYNPNVMIAIDESGSVGNEQVATFLDEVKKIVKNSSDKVELVIFDTAIAHTQTLKKESQVQVKRHSTGGTDFNAVFKYAKEKKPDVFIVMTDGYAPAPEITVKCPVLWVLTKHNDSAHLSGKKVTIDV